MQTARIWIPHRDSFVRIRVTAWNETVVSVCGATDEGYYRRVDSYYLTDDGEAVICESTEDHRDCDGRHSSRNVFSWPLNGPTKAAWIDWGPRDEDGDPTDIVDESVQLPEWKRTTSEQRDQYAEMMGY